MYNVSLFLKGIRDHICDHCGQAFFDKYVLRTHINKMHSGKSWFKCDFDGCDFHCEKMRERKKHVKEVHAHEGYKFNCDACPRGYNNIRYLQDHIGKN